MNKLALLGCVVLAGTAQAQARSSDEDLAAWYGLMTTPVGAFPSSGTLFAGRTDLPRQLAIHASSWKAPGSDVSENSFGVSYLSTSATNLRFGGTVGWVQPSGGSSNSGTIIVGLDAANAFWRSGTPTNGGSAISLNWKTSFGFGHSSDAGGIEYWSVVAQVPLEWTYSMANKSALSVLASAGYGVAGVGDAADAEQGFRPLFSAAAAWTSAGGVGVHLGTQKVTLDSPLLGEPPWVTGISVSFPFGGKK